MTKKVICGECAICGANGPLSFEHIPPKGAFNERRVIRYGGPNALQLILGPEEQVKGEISQKGSGDKTLCHRCNNLTGHWYGNQFIEFCYQGMDLLNKTLGKPTLVYMNYIFPLPIIKQIISMFLSVSYGSLRKAEPYLVTFVLNKERMYLPPSYRLYLYYNIEGRFRMTANTLILNTSSHRALRLCEISYPPFGYVLRCDGGPAPHKDMFDISYFSRFSYNEFHVLNLKAPVLPTHSVYPGDYRTLSEIQRELVE